MINVLFSPLQYLLHYLVSVKSLVNRHAWSRAPVAETSWALLRDCYHGDMCIRHTPQHLAIAALYLALNTYGVELPVGEKEWWQVRVSTLGLDVKWQKFSCLRREVFSASYVSSGHPCKQKPP